MQVALCAVGVANSIRAGSKGGSFVCAAAGAASAIIPHAKRNRIVIAMIAWRTDGVNGKARGSREMPCGRHTRRPKCDLARAAAAC
jgi:hypothetical protein